jgi:tetraacyldisaccharide 4'-kinase
MKFNIRIILWPFSLLYGIVIYFRNLFFDTGELESVSFGVPVISIGNITAGGTGKTPHVEFLASALSDDRRVAVLSRGYGRKGSGFLLVRKDSGVAEAGDEPLQVKRKYPHVIVAVDNKRVHGIKKLLKFKKPPEVVILDDAFQHRYVKPQLSILLVSYQRPLFNDLLLPAGNLREPKKNARRADMVIVSKCPALMTQDEMEDFTMRMKLKKGPAIYFTTYSYGQPAYVFPGKHNRTKPPGLKKIKKNHAGILLVSGIADPGPLKRYLQNEAELTDSIVYGDHHMFTERDLAFISSRFGKIKRDEKYIFLTEKDAVRMQEIKIKNRELRKAMCYIPVTVKFLAKSGETFLNDIADHLKKAPDDISLGL